MVATLLLFPLLFIFIYLVHRDSVRRDMKHREDVAKWIQHSTESLNEDLTEFLLEEFEPVKEDISKFRERFNAPPAEARRLDDMNEWIQEQVDFGKSKNFVKEEVKNLREV